MARRTKYDTHVQPRLEEIEAWCRDGLIDEDISKLLGVAYSTFKEYKKNKPALLDALKRNKAIADIRVEESLYNKATSKTIKKMVPIKLKRTYVEDGYVLAEEYIEMVEVEEEIPPDTTAMIFWLKNRKPTEWRDKRDVEHSGEMTTNVNNMNNLSEEELRKLAKLDGD
ncbi:transposase [Mammaliicoccus fleurettii]|uniref:transposase n=1 Tax=Mammaliicoccus fleurettii TaxID=150056 RepID=UPI002DB8B915|nr:transposase [Mammaliicoccus fleurettii]MEB7723398.1 transposase [Mammaliicoccus fleurettii]